MRIETTPLAGLLVVHLDPVKDNRGCFTRLWDIQWEFCTDDLQWNQDSISYSRQKGTLRGLHFQHKPREQAKYVVLLEGKITDIAVDLRLDSPTFGNWVACEMDAAIPKALFIPPGFAHGFVTRSDNCLILYKMDAPYDPNLESGIVWNDPDLNIDWGITDPIISDRDRSFGTFSVVTQEVNRRYKNEQG